MALILTFFILSSLCPSIPGFGCFVSFPEENNLDIILLKIHLCNSFALASAKGIMGALLDYLQEFLAILELPSVNLKNDENVAFKQGKHWNFYSNSPVLDSNKLFLKFTHLSLENLSSAKILKLGTLAIPKSDCCFYQYFGLFG